MSRTSRRVDWITDWLPDSRARADARWAGAFAAQTFAAMSGKRCLEVVRQRLVLLERFGILQPREQERVQELPLGALASADQERLKKLPTYPSIYAISLAAPSAEPGQDRIVRSLALSRGRRLVHGRLYFQAFVDDSVPRPVGMNVMLRGRDPARNCGVYVRYDLDAVPMGSTRVTHFDAHWHFGDDPDAADAETHDPRLPAPVLDPLAVIETLVETFFPDGPHDLA